MSELQTIPAFLLTRQWQDTPKGILLDFWFSTDQGAVNVQIENQQAVFFIRQQDAQPVKQLLSGKMPVSIKALELKNFDFEQVSGIYFKNQRQLYQAREILQQHNIACYEADIRPTERYLMERFISGPACIFCPNDSGTLIRNPRIKPTDFQPELKVLSLDIETAFDSQELYSIALLTEHWQICLMCGNSPKKPSEKSTNIEYHVSEQALMLRFIELIQQQDPDIIIGWNVINFDFRFLQRKADSLKLSLSIGRGNSTPVWRQAQTEQNHYFMLLPGRVVLDGIDTLKSATRNFESFALDYVAVKLLGRGKLIPSAAKNTDTHHDPLYKAREISRLFREDKKSLAQYNIEDCQLVLDIFKHTDLINFAIERARLTGLEMDRNGGSVAAFDNQYLPRLHRKGFVASRADDQSDAASSPGGYVMNSRPGLFDSVLVLDYKSLYPSIIRTFKVDPYAFVQARVLSEQEIIPGYKGIGFAREGAILPEIIKSLWHARDKARAENNAALSQAIKIIMNSFYGVLGTPGCRIHDARLTSSITMRGHDLIKQTVILIEQQGYEVIYGDTDSVFVSLGGALSNEQADHIGEKLVAVINSHWQEILSEQYQIESYLEMEYETHFKRFFMPTIRGSEKGSKKRYAGLIAGRDNDKIIYKGLETVRTDWTALARTVQQELFGRVFYNRGYKDYLKDIVLRLKAGELDEQLIYRKRLRQKLADYQKNCPPHAQAAIKAEAYAREKQGQVGRYEKGGWIEYVITTHGAEPIEYNSWPLDYEHYIEKQLAPVVDALLMLQKTSLEKVIQAQYELF